VIKIRSGVKEETATKFIIVENSTLNKPREDSRCNLSEEKMDCMKILSYETLGTYVVI